MKKLILKISSFSLIFLLLASILVPRALAENSQGSRLKLVLTSPETGQDHNDLVASLTKEERENAYLEYFHLTDLYISNSDAKMDLVTRFHGKDLDELFDESARRVSKIYFHDGYISVEGIEPGSYYVRDIISSPSLHYAYEFVFAVEDSKEETIYAKGSPPEEPEPEEPEESDPEESEETDPEHTDPENSEETDPDKPIEETTEKDEEPKYGNHEFLKVSNDKDKSPLEGAVFRVTIKEGDNYKTVQKNGKDYEVESGPDGRFSVKDLAYGTYYLWEIKAPEGHIQLRQAVEFTIGPETSRSNILVITNKEKTPIIVPETGDLAAYLIGGLSLLAISVGLYMILSKDENKDKKNS